MSRDRNRPEATVEHIAICGAGLAGCMTAAVLAHSLPAAVRLTLVDCPGAGDLDLFYGSVTAPSAYDFNLMAGVAEPRLILESDAAFSLGTRYSQWGDERSWIQCFQLPLPVIDGVLLHQYLARQGMADLEPLLVGAAAARLGVFAHPPQGGNHPLSQAEYGYQFDPYTYAGLFAGASDADRVQKVAADISGVDRGENGIIALHLSNGQSCAADLYVDCTGPAGKRLSRLAGAFHGTRRLRAVSGRSAAGRLGAPLRTVTAGAFGWRAETPLKAAVMRLTVFDPACEGDALAGHGDALERTGEATLGRHAQAWRGNCVAIGHAAGVVEPLTPAPLVLLQRDIERLASLIPVSADMSVERREFNRQFNDDYRNANLFNRALFEPAPRFDTPYWRAAREEPLDDRLARKIEQFLSRGLHVAFDLEPFNREDWIIQHYGMGRRPRRHDRVADRVPEDRVRPYLSALSGRIEHAVRTLPSHDVYMTSLTGYLKMKDA